MTKKYIYEQERWRDILEAFPTEKQPQRLAMIGKKSKLGSGVKGEEKVSPLTISIEAVIWSVPQKLAHTNQAWINYT